VAAKYFRGKRIAAGSPNAQGKAMKTSVILGVALLATTSVSALAQTATDTVTTRSTTSGIVAVPSPESSSTTRTTRSVDANGNRVDSKTTVRNDDGVTKEKTVTRSEAAPPVSSTTTTTVRQ